LPEEKQESGYKLSVHLYNSVLTHESVPKRGNVSFYCGVNLAYPASFKKCRSNGINLQNTVFFTVQLFEFKRM